MSHRHNQRATRVVVDSSRVVWPESAHLGYAPETRAKVARNIVKADTDVANIATLCREFGVECLCVTRSNGRLIVDRSGGVTHLGITHVDDMAQLRE